MKVVHLLTSLNPGGQTTVIRHLLPELLKHGIKSEIVTILSKGDFFDLLKNKGIPVHICYKDKKINFTWSYAIGKFIRKSGNLTFGIRLSSLLKKIKPDIVHSHIHGNLWATQLYASHSANAPFLINLHSPKTKYPYTWKARNLFLPFFRDYDCLTAVSPSIMTTYKEFLNRIEKKCSVKPQMIPNCIPDPGPRDMNKKYEIRKSLHIPENSIVIGCVSRLLQLKKIDDLIHATNNLLKLNYNVQLLLVGDGLYRKNLESLVNELDIHSRVHFTGMKTNPQYWTHAIDIYSLPSTFEGFGISTLESMALGIPYVGTRILGTKDLIKHEYNGLLVTSENIDELTSAIKKLIDNPGLSKKIGENARKSFLEKYQIENSSKSYIDLYNKMIYIKYN